MKRKSSVIDLMIYLTVFSFFLALAFAFIQIFKANEKTYDITKDNSQYCIYTAITNPEDPEAWECQKLYGDRLLKNKMIETMNGAQAIKPSKSPFTIEVLKDNGHFSCDIKQFYLTGDVSAKTTCSLIGSDAPEQVWIEDVVKEVLTDLQTTYVRGS